MDLSEREIEFLNANRSAAMITVTPDGVAKAARVGVGLFEGKLWSSATADRVRTKRLRTDPRCTIYVHDAAYGHLVIEGSVTILDGPDVPQLSLRYFRMMMGKPTGPLNWFGAELEEEQFLQTMVDEHRIICEITPTRTYGVF
jgi:hypothetical protein